MTTKGWTEEQKKYLADNFNKVPTQEIAKHLNKSYFSVWRHAKLYLVQTTEASTTNAQGEPTIVTSRKPVLKIDIKPDADGLVIEVQTNDEFENFLSSSKQLRKTDRLLGQEAHGEFYMNACFNSLVDDINSDIIVGRNNTLQLNMAILRIKGIRSGIKAKTTRLVTETQLRKMVKKFMQDYKDFYKMTIKRTSISGMLYEEPEAQRKVENV